MILRVCTYAKGEVWQPRLMNSKCSKPMTQFYNNDLYKFQPVSKDHICPNCGKDHWCYTLSDSLICCKRHDIVPLADGWKVSKKSDSEGTPYLYRKEFKEKPNSFKYYAYQDLEGNDLLRIVRIGYEYRAKDQSQERWTKGGWIAGTGDIDRTKVPPYRFAEAQKAHEDGKKIFLVEGEKTAEALIQIGIAATCLYGGSGKHAWSNWHAELMKNWSLVICPDRDEPGVNHALRVAESFPNAEWLYAPPSEFYWDWSHLPKSRGSDVADWLEDKAIDKDTVISYITEDSPNKYLTGSNEKKIAEVSPEIVPEENYNQKAIDALYGDADYISVHDEIYKYNGTHYEALNRHAELRRIRDWANVTPIQTGNGRWTYMLAKPAKVREIWDWVVFSFSVDPTSINPPGINCLNGVVTINWKGKKPQIKLVDHSPTHHYTYCSQIEYDEHADSTDCDRLLQALEPAQQTIFLRTIAASLDLDKIRKFSSGGVKALLCKGSGSNGKDALRAAIRVILGDGMTSVTLSDFKAYDEGRKFGLAKLETSRINWASENTGFVKLDSLQSLKQAVTGEPLDIERKGVQDYSFDPKSIFLFNINESPLIDGGLQAIRRRYAVLDFNKTFCQNADPSRGEIEADPRFRYDPNFLNERVCPALLNKLLEALAVVAAEGINYAEAEESLQRIQEESNHLWRFCNDIGLVDFPGGKIYLKDLYERLLDWYQETGTLEVVITDRGTKKIWNDQARPSDKNITAINQLTKRLQALFPKIRSKRDLKRVQGVREVRTYVEGITITGSPVTTHETLTESAGSHGSPKTITLTVLLGEAKNLTEYQALQAIDFIKQLKNPMQMPTDDPNYGDPCDPAHSIRDSWVDSGDPLADPNSQCNENVTTQTITIDNSVDLNFNSTPSYASWKASEQKSNQLTKINQLDPDKEIDWVKLLNGSILNDCDREGLYVTGRKSGMRKRHKVAAEEVAEYHYKDEQQDNQEHT